VSRFQPLISVVMPVHNVAPWVRAAVHSILRQTYGNLEFIIVDDSSTDDTRKILNSMEDSRLRIIDADHTGYVKALAAGIHEAKGEWIARMDGDDVAHPERLKRTLDFIEQHPDCVLAGTAYGYITPNRTLLRRPKVNFEWRPLTRSLLSKGRICYESSMIFHRKTAVEVGLYDLDFPWKEITLWYRLLSQGCGYEINSCGMFYRYHRIGANTGQWAHRMQTAKVRERYDPEAYQEYYSKWPQLFPDQRSVDMTKIVDMIKQCRAAKDYGSMVRYGMKALHLNRSYQELRSTVQALTGSLRPWKWHITFGQSEFEVFIAETAYVSSVLAEMGFKFGPAYPSTQGNS
jgi:glycosyltransferase involved in cell wall biosynthesis